MGTDIACSGVGAVLSGVLEGLGVAAVFALGVGLLAAWLYVKEQE